MPTPSRLAQHFGTQSGQHPAHLQWSDASRFPIAAPPNSIGLLTKDDIDQFIKVVKYRCRWFDLAKPEDLEEYTQVMECIASGWYILRHQSRVEFPNENPPRVMTWVEWMQQYNAPPKNSRMLSNGQSR